MSTSNTLIDGRTFQRLCQARDFAAAHLDRPINVALLARQASFSQWHFHRLFTEAFGETPHAFLSAMRLRRAKQLLASDSVSVTDVCFEAGFSSAGSFSSWFRASSGMSPSAYRRTVRKVFGTHAQWRFIYIPSCFLRISWNGE